MLPQYGSVNLIIYNTLYPFFHILHKNKILQIDVYLKTLFFVLLSLSSMIFTLNNRRRSPYE